MKQLRVGFLSSKNYFIETTFSGTLLSMYRSLVNRPLDVVPLGRPLRDGGRRRIFRRIRCHRELTPRSETFQRDCEQFISLVNKQLRRRTCDVLFAPVASAEMYLLDSGIPTVYASDATFRLLNEDYDLGFSPAEQELAHQLEKVAIEKADVLLYSSRWAAQSAMNDYGASASKIEVVDFGANIEKVPALETVSRDRGSEQCRLLFVGRDWDRKGGAVAVDTLRALRAKGIRASMTMLGCIPPDDVYDDDLTVIPFLDKRDRLQRTQVNNLYLESHFLLLPTRADCSPIVICEANAFGLPVLTTEVGGVPSLIRDGVNGRMLPLSASGEDFARVIAEEFGSPEGYRQLVRSARAEYDTRLNWNCWGEKVEAILRSAIGR